MPEYTAAGDLVLPKNFETWVYLGSPLTPNTLNGGKANFPEYHYVYIEPVAYAIYQRTKVFPDGTIMFKELQLTLPKQFPDGSRTAPSGRGFFPGNLNGADVLVKGTKRFAATAAGAISTSTIAIPRPRPAKCTPMNNAPRATPPMPRKT